MSTTALVISILVGSTALLAALGRAIHAFYTFCRRIETSITYVEGEMRNSGGSTMRDAIDRMEHRLVQVESTVNKETP